MNWWESINWFYVVLGIVIGKITGGISRGIFPEDKWKSLLLDFCMFTTVVLIIVLFIL